jgi:glutamate---cysteine ligase / carboxylate-amine ligase
MVNFVELTDFTFGKELQLHVMELKANQPFKSPVAFEETMHKAVVTVNEFLNTKFHAFLLGTGMHPLLRLEGTGVWPHHHRRIYEEYSKIFNLKQHGWLNIQSFHLNLPYANKKEGITLHNRLAELSAYIPAISATSPFFEGKAGPAADNRLTFYKLNQIEVPSITSDIVPEYASSIKNYQQNVIGGYSRDLAKAGADKTILNREWVNSRGVIFRFDRKALELRVMDEQECTRSDVALSCFVRAALRGLVMSDEPLISHGVLVADLNAVIAKGLDAKVVHPWGTTARHVCQHIYNVAWANADAEEKHYLPLVQRRITEGSLSEVIRRKVQAKAPQAGLKEAIVTEYSTLIKCLATNQPYF